MASEFETHLEEYTKGDELSPKRKKLLALAEKNPLQERYGRRGTSTEGLTEDEAWVSFVITWRFAADGLQRGGLNRTDYDKFLETKVFAGITNTSYTNLLKIDTTKPGYSLLVRDYLTDKLAETNERTGDPVYHLILPESCHMGQLSSEQIERIGVVTSDLLLKVDFGQPDSGMR